MSFHATEVKPGLFYTGTTDPDLRVFDIVMMTTYGTSYNSFVLKGREKTCLFETTKPKFYDQFLARINDAIGPQGQVDYIIMNHTEPDHSGSMLRLYQERFPNATLVCTQMAYNFASKVHNFKFPNWINTGTTRTLDLGGLTLQFLIAPLLHWPDSMMTYCPELKTVFTCDVFGAHYSHEGVFNDNVASDANYMEAYRYYYDCIFGPFKPSVLKGLAQLDKLDIETICCAHGPVIRSEARRYMELYRQWSTMPPLQEKVALAYVSAYGYTGEMAQAIAEGVRSQGVPCDTFDMVTQPKGDFWAAFERSKGVLLGTPTLVADALPQIWEIATTFNRIVHNQSGQRIASVFGTYGWSGEAIKNIDDRLRQVGFTLPLNPLKVQFRASADELRQCHEYGVRFARAVKGEPINERLPAKPAAAAAPAPAKPATAAPAPAAH
ncbi:putative Flavo-diiron protein FprA1 [Paratrimastix pyriformis]|uniref:Flavo-diiron protein FprA1 n=1 Tax=Paratrimastix pyriformis TaxID=342808 RepID=A0ABQ8U812_9EUKA|nr:putative Flavo-diiron protein FprA1 [Paratrimastix pyriformis]|eukprot:GAFH01001664.1.p2 GENE.GAFH01001664.1~~GAFH01001664.1.p2  ORF type:complete len:437 (+),score=143.85 GAFH01001664.1:71-1381(+)